MSGAVQIPVGVADTGDHRLVVLELGNEALGQVGAVQSFGVWALYDFQLADFSLSLPAGLPPVNSGDRIKATDAWVMNACLIERSTVNGMVASSVSV
jgi:hypothetical protein